MESLTHFQSQRQIPTNFISLWIDANPKAVPRLAFCMWCRAPLFQVTGDIVTIMPGDEEKIPPLTIQCRNRDCGYKYHIHLPVEKI